MSETPGDFVGLLDAPNCGAAIVHRSGRVIYVNERLATMMGRPRNELIGADWRRLYNNQAGCGFLQELFTYFDEPREGETELPLPAGRVLPVMSSARRLGDSPLMIDHRLVTLIDISGQKAAERDLKEQLQTIAKLS